MKQFIKRKPRQWVKLPGLRNEIDDNAPIVRVLHAMNLECVEVICSVCRGMKRGKIIDFDATLKRNAFYGIRKIIPVSAPACTAVAFKLNGI